MAAVSEREDPFRSFNFRVEADGMEFGSFSEVSGLNAQGDMVEYRVGTDPNYKRKLVAQRKFENITLKRGFIRSATFWDMYEKVLNGRPDRFGGSIFLRDEAGRDVMRWNFKNGFVNEVHGPTFNAGGNEVAIEQVIIVHEELTMELLPPSGGA